MKFEKLLESPRFFRGLGFFLGTLLLVEVNVVAARHVFRGSFGSSEKFELSSESRAYFTDIRERIQITGFVPKGDAHAEIVSLALEELRLLGVAVTTFDPDGDRARFAAALGDEEFDDKTPLAVVSSDTRRVVVGDDPNVLTFSSLVEKLSRAASEVTRDERRKLCFFSGHGERSPSDSSPAGASHFASLAERANVEVELVESDSNDGPSECAGLLVLGQTRPFSAKDMEAIARTAAAGVPLALYVDPIVGPEKRVEKSGLEPLLATLGITAKNNLVLEHDATKRPHGEAEETFFPIASDHPLSSTRKELGPAFTFSRQLELLPNSLATVLFRTSDDSTTKGRLGETHLDSTPRHSSVVAVAIEGKTNRGAGVRAAIFGTSSPISNLALGGDAGYEHRALARRTLAFLLDERIAPLEEAEKISEKEPLSEDFVEKLIAFAVVVEPLFFLGVFVALSAHRRTKRGEVPS